jgi:hypothetical protein
MSYYLPNIHLRDPLLFVKLTELSLLDKERWRVQVYGICFCPVAKNSELKALGVDDSKALTEEQR